MLSRQVRFIEYKQQIAENKYDSPISLFSNILEIAFVIIINKNELELYGTNCTQLIHYTFIHEVQMKRRKENTKPVTNSKAAYMLTTNVHLIGIPEIHWDRVL